METYYHKSISTSTVDNNNKFTNYLAATRPFTAGQCLNGHHIKNVNKKGNMFSSRLQRQNRYEKNRNNHSFQQSQSRRMLGGDNCKSVHNNCIQSSLDKHNIMDNHIPEKNMETSMHNIDCIRNKNITNTKSHLSQQKSDIHNIKKMDEIQTLNLKREDAYECLFKIIISPQNINQVIRPFRACLSDENQMKKSNLAKFTTSTDRRILAIERHSKCNFILPHGLDFIPYRGNLCLEVIIRGSLEENILVALSTMDTLMPEIAKKSIINRKNIKPVVLFSEPTQYTNTEYFTLLGTSDDPKMNNENLINEHPYINGHLNISVLDELADVHQNKSNLCNKTLRNTATSPLLSTMSKKSVNLLQNVDTKEGKTFKTQSSNFTKILCNKKFNHCSTASPSKTRVIKLSSKNKILPNLCENRNDISAEESNWKKSSIEFNHLNLNNPNTEKQTFLKKNSLYKTLFSVNSNCQQDTPLFHLETRVLNKITPCPNNSIENNTAGTELETKTVNSITDNSLSMASSFNSRTPKRKGFYESLRDMFQRKSKTPSFSISYNRPQTLSESKTIDTDNSAITVDLSCPNFKIDRDNCAIRLTVARSDYFQKPLSSENSTIQETECFSDSSGKTKVAHLEVDITPDSIRLFRHDQKGRLISKRLDLLCDKFGVNYDNSCVKLRDKTKIIEVRISYINLETLVTACQFISCLL